MTLRKLNETYFGFLMKQGIRSDYIKIYFLRLGITQDFLFGRLVTFKELDKSAFDFLVTSDARSIYKERGL
jgi:hypothetical protein